MKVLALDIWQDLRQKRLAPVAILLAIAIVAIPAVLLRPSGDSGGAVPAAAVAPAPDGDLEIVSAESDSPKGGSNLGVFDPKNPFEPDGPGPRGVKAPELVVTEDTTEVTASEPGDSVGGDPAPGTGQPTPTPQPVTPRTKTTEYEYVADITFWNGERRRRIHGLRKLDMLPSEATPLLVFMGVTDGGGNAVFLVDSTLRAAGEGACRPSRASCAFLYVGPGSEELLTNDAGDSYRLRIDEIRRVEVRAGASRRRPTRAGTAAAEPRRFVPPFMSDVVVETSVATPTPSAGDANDR